MEAKPKAGTQNETKTKFKTKKIKPKAKTISKITRFDNLSFCYYKKRYKCFSTLNEIQIDENHIHINNAKKLKLNRLISSN